ncbi:MAG: urea ABC transporter permease subunit UrtC [Peptococcaceae bacterium]|nr:urea ABC transporter permease subunit UrtC [Peptococcaceae bacterium]
MKIGIHALKKVPVHYWIDIALFIFILVFPLLGFKPFRVTYMNQFVAYLIFALSLDLIWGYMGLMSLGHAVLFGMGGYAIGLCAQLQNGAPAFMTREGMNQIPTLLFPMVNPIFATFAGLLLPTLFAFFLGKFLFKSKVSGVFFTIITLALAQIIKDLVINQQAFTNGFNGLQGVPRAFLGLGMDKTAYYYFVAGVLILVYVCCRWLTNSRLGKVAVSIRENESRVSFLGYNPENFKILIFAISGFLAGLSGLLYAPAANSITVEEISVAASTFVLIGLAVGGRGNLTGALVGAMGLQWAKVLLSESTAAYWQLVLGAILLIIIFVMPNGLIGQLLHLVYSLKTRKHKELTGGGA